jgi:hypothetical protein
MKPPTEKPTIEIPIHGPQSTVFTCASALKASGADDEYLETTFFNDCRNAGWHRKRALIDVARKYAKVEFDDDAVDGPDGGKPQVKIGTDDDIKSILDKVRKALDKGGAESSYLDQYICESIFCEHRDEFLLVAENYVEIA